MGLFGSTTTLQLDIEGMTCGHCVHTVTQALEGVPGVKKAAVDLEAGKAEVTAKEDVSTDDLVAAVEATQSYHAKPAA